MSICSTLSKIFIVLVNFLFWALSGGLIFLSAWILTEHAKFGHLSSLLDSSLLPAYVLLATGVVLFALGTVGCVGVLREHKFLVGLYFSLLLVAFVGIVVGVVVAYVYRGKLKGDLEKVVQQGLEHYNNDTSSQKAVNWMQSELHCCGVHNYTDWLKTTWHASHKAQPYPSSCCVNNTCHYTTSSHAHHDPNLYYDGCYEKLRDQFYKHIDAILGVIFATAFLILLGMISTCVLMRIRRADDFIYRDLSDTDGMRV